MGEFAPVRQNTTSDHADFIKRKEDHADRGRHPHDTTMGTRQA
jgi:hypothetical protein